MEETQASGASNGPETRSHQKARPWLLALAGMGGLSLAGCAQFWDDVTASTPGASFGDNFAFRMKLLTNRFEPMVVLRDSKDGDLRARALRMIDEPIREGGNDEDQQFALNLLATAARTEKHRLCRLAAVEKLADYQDPRAADALAEAIRTPLNFGDENAVVRMAIVKKLAETNHPEAAEILADAVERDDSTDVRIAAARGLGRFDSYKATKALVQVLKEDRDLALRNQAHLSLQAITQKELPATAEAWEEFLYSAASDRLQASAQDRTRGIRRTSR